MTQILHLKPNALISVSEIKHQNISILSNSSSYKQLILPRTEIWLADFALDINPTRY